MASGSEAYRLHSRYNPGKEAARYIDAQSFSCNPVYIVVTEPGESFLAQELRTRYPAAKLIAIRYDKATFADTDTLWDGVWRPGTGFDVSSWLFSIIPDEYLPLTVFLPWKPSDSVWPAISAYVWSNIASVIKLQTSVMYTRSMFGKRWLKNCFRNIVLAKNGARSERTGKPVLLAASGPSLETLFPFDRNSFYVCAVSSSLTCLAHHGVKPDICISTDGGFWALNHFRGIDESIKVAFPCEAAIPSYVLERNPVQFLDYGSALEKELFRIAGCVPESAARNGTVSGTAALYMLDHTVNNVYASGLDLSPSIAFSHARPHAGGNAIASADSRMRPLSDMLYAANRESAALDIYASWFANRSETFKRRFFRIGSFGKELSGIESVAIQDINTALRLDLSRSDEPVNVATDIRPRDERKDRLIEWIRDLRSMLSAADETLLERDLVSEIFQMVSYTGYIRYLKKRHGQTVPESSGDISREILLDTIGFLDHAESMVRALKVT